MTSNQGERPSNLAPPQDNAPKNEEEDVDIEIAEEEEDAMEENSVVFTDHKEPVYCVAFSPRPLSNGAIAFASGSNDETAVIYQVVGDAEPVRIILRGHTESINCIQFSPDGTMLATGDLKGEIRTWNSLNGQMLAQMMTSTAEGTESAQDQHEPKKEEPKVELKKAPKEEEPKAEPKKAPKKVEPKVESKHSHKKEHECDEEECDYEECDEEECDGEEGEEEDIIKETKGVEWISWHPTLPAILAGDAAGFIWLFNAKTAKCAKVYSCHNGPVNCGGFRSDATKIWSGGEDAVLKVWAPKTGEAVATFSGLNAHTAPITSGCSSPHGALIATGDATGTVKVTRFDDAHYLGTISTGEESIESMEFSPDNTMIAVASMNGSVSIWNSNAMTMRHALSHPAGVTSLKWHQTRPYIVTGCLDGIVRVWDSRDGRLITMYEGHQGPIYMVDVRAIDRNRSDCLIASCSEDSTVRLYSFVEEELESQGGQTEVETPK